MAHRFSNVLVHLVFSTKNRANLIPNALRANVWKYLIGIGRNYSIPILAVGGTANHVHMLMASRPDLTLAKTIQVLKANS